MILGDSRRLLQAPRDCCHPKKTKNKNKNLISFGFGLGPAGRAHGGDRAAWQSTSVHVAGLLQGHGLHGRTDTGSTGGTPCEGL